MAEFKLDDETMRTIFVKSIMDHLTEEKRTELLQGAISSFLETVEEKVYSPGSYGSKTVKTTKMEMAFRDAAFKSVGEICRELVSTDTYFREQTILLFNDVAHSVFEGPARDKMVQVMANAIVSGMRADQ